MTAKVITFTAIKGGVGKTTLSYNLADFLARIDNNIKVLLVDLDFQASLSSNYDLSDEQLAKCNLFPYLLAVGKNTELPELQPMRISNIEADEHIDGLSYIDDHHTEELGQLLPSSTQRQFLLYRTLNNLNLLDKYDYIICDTHPDTFLASQNAVVISDFVISPLEPSRYGVESLIKTSQQFDELKNLMINPMSNESYITAKLYFVGNKFKRNTRSSQTLEKQLKQADTLAIFPERELFNKANTSSCSIFYYHDHFSMNKAETASNRKAIQEIIPDFQGIYKVIQ